MIYLRAILYFLKGQFRKLTNLRVIVISKKSAIKLPKGVSPQMIADWKAKFNTAYLNTIQIKGKDQSDLTIILKPLHDPALLEVVKLASKHVMEAGAMIVLNNNLYQDTNLLKDDGMIISEFVAAFMIYSHFIDLPNAKKGAI